MKKLILSCYLSLIVWAINAQNVVTIDHKTQRSVGTESTFKRGKYITMHSFFNKPDAPFTNFKSAYNIDASYKGSRSTWGPLALVRGGVIPNVKNKISGDREVIPLLTTTGFASHLFHDKSVDYSEVDISEFSTNVASYIAKSYKQAWDFAPHFYEPFNEPFIHAADYYPGPQKRSKDDAIITKMSQFHKNVAEAIHNTPELKNMRVMGYASAYPQFEAGDFDLWRNRYKKFMDIAGAEMDLFSIHLYDGVGLNNKGGRRSGSNLEAILDMIEAYSFQKFGSVKPIAVTEFGRLVPNQPGWTEGGNISNYDPVTNSQAVRSQNHMMMSFIERGNDLSVSIPFTVNRRDGKEKYAKSTLWIKDENGQLQMTARRFFYEIWKDVQGDRVRINTNNIDVQSLAVVNGDKLYVVLNNLNDSTQTVNLNLLNKDGLQNVNIKRLKVFTDKTPELTIDDVNIAPENLSIDYGETVVLTYTFAENITFDNKIVSKKYYATSTLQAIKAQEDITFTINDVVTGQGEATLRLGVGREHGKSLTPIVSINGTNVSISGDIIKGYDQNTRSQFFGTLEIPFDISLLKPGTNEVKVRFTDEGGYVTSSILQVQTLDKTEEVIKFIGAPTVLPSSTTYTFEVAYVAAQPRDIIVAIVKNGVWVSSKTVTIEAGASRTHLSLTSSTPVLEGDNYELRAIMREVGGNYKTNVDRQVIPNFEIKGQEGIDFVDPPQKLLVADSYKFNVQYTTAISRDLLLAFVKGDEVLAEEKITVEAGSATIPVTFNFANKLAAGTDYEIQAIIREKDGDNSTDLQTKQIPLVLEHIFFIVNRNTLKKIRSQSIHSDKVEQVPASWTGDPTRWTLINTDEGYFHLKNIKTGKYLRPETNANGADLILADESDTSDWTQWEKVPTSQGYFYLKNRETKMYFRPIDDANRAKVIQRPTGYSYHNTQWQFVDIAVSSNQARTTQATHFDIEEQVEKTPFDFSMFPNPMVHGTLHLKFQTKEKTSIEIYNQLGLRVYTNTCMEADMTIPLNNLNKGIYFVKVQSNATTLSKILIVK